MKTIVIETAKFTADKGFVYQAFQHFPSSAKGLTLAVIAAERMMQIEAYHIAHADIRVTFKDGQTDGGQLDDAQLFKLIERHRHNWSILKECAEVMDGRAAVSIERTNKIKIARAAIEDMIEAGYSFNAGSVEWSKNADEIMKQIVAADLDITLIVSHAPKGRTQMAGYIVLEDGKDHEIFARAIGPGLFEDELYRAFGLINEANDDGEISDLAA
ncbi:hypothetical protein [Agrobacterium tumefaciens]|uniref:hypothetical protein n=1 Tax=Agrobacterium tumefaciens TaxID=358 RepID=UPI0015749F0D|nr:hypothetical protein [Agrobacterium tumefaciens]